MQERRTYIPQGWTKFYEFSYGDLKAGTYVIEVGLTLFPSIFVCCRGDQSLTVPMFV